MTKSEMGEWLAENVLGIIKLKGRWFHGKDGTGWNIDDLVDFIYSPDGFFAVWDAVEKKLMGTNLTFNHIPENGNVYCTIIKQYPHAEWSSKTKDRYEAFYNAVYEAMKGEKE